MVQFQKSDIKNPHFKPHIIFSLKLKMIVLIGVLIVTSMTVIGLFIDHFISSTLEVQLGKQALSVAESVAHIPELALAFAHEDPAAIINPIAVSIQQATGAEFIVVGNKEEIRYAHPISEQIGKKMVGEDSERALHKGESYVSKAVGSLGSSLRAKVPVYLGDEIVGVVSVGFLTEDLKNIIRSYHTRLWMVLFLITLAAIGGAVIISSYIKKVMFGLEPEEIAHLLFQKETILQSTHEGILAVNQDGVITMINSAAQRLLFNQQNKPSQYIGKTVQEISPAHQLVAYLNDRNAQVDKEMLIDPHTVFVNKVPIYFEGMFMGSVSTLRNKTEIDLLTKELTRVKQYTRALRAQTHEFANKLSVIHGLLQLNKFEEAMAFIQKESTLQKKWIHLLIQKVEDPLISGLLLGKLNEAHERGIHLSIQEESVIATRLNEKKGKVLLTAIGNLIDNAMDAVKNQPPSNRKISIFFTDIGDDLLFEIEDSGNGVPDVYAVRIFEQGFSTKKGEHRGFGLALTKRMLEEVDGALYLEDGELGGASFVLSIPKDSGERNEWDAR